MNKYRLLRRLLPLFALASTLTSQAVNATSINPLDDGGWALVAHISNSGGYFDGLGELAPDYSYGTFVSNPSPGTSDFQRAFPFQAQNILFITGDGSAWGITGYATLRALIDNPVGDYSTGHYEPNIAFEALINGVVGEVQGNVLSRVTYAGAEDPWITLNGSHWDGILNQTIIWGQNDYYAGDGREILKNAHSGVNVYISAVPLPGTFVLLGSCLAGLGIIRRKTCGDR